MDVFMPRSTFYKNYQRVWMKKHDKLDKLINHYFKVLFSTSKIRVLSARFKNPPENLSATMFGDGHDTRINFSSMHSIVGFKNREKFYSYKLKQPGLRTQVVIDINNFILYVSPSVAAKKH